MLPVYKASQCIDGNRKIEVWYININRSSKIILHSVGSMSRNLKRQSRTRSNTARDKCLIFTFVLFLLLGHTFFILCLTRFSFKNCVRSVEKKKKKRVKCTIKLVIPIGVFVSTEYLKVKMRLLMQQY